MWLLLSGEGLGDIGSCDMSMNFCEGSDFRVGPMARIVDKLVELQQDYSPIDYELTRFISKRFLAASGKQLQSKKSLSLPGAKRSRETLYFERNACALAIAARTLSQEKEDSVIAVLFRDSDGTHSSGRGLWRDKLNSMTRGFEKEGFHNGVPMVPKPKSEAWLLCAVKANPYQHCADLENEPGNDDAPNPLKRQLSDVAGEVMGAAAWADKVNTGGIDLDAIDMPSFNDFRQTLTDALENI